MAQYQIYEIELSMLPKAQVVFWGEGAQNQIGQLSRSAMNISVNVLSKQILLIFAIFNIYSVQFIL